MSLFAHWRQQTLARAVAGDLPDATEERMRVHLRACARCRDRYDALARAAEGLAASAGRPHAVAAARERARLMAALSAASAPAAPAPARPPLRAWRRLAPALALAPLAAAGVWLLLARPAPTTDVTADVTSDVTSDITWRGAGDEAPAAAPGTLVIYAARKQPGGGAGAARVVAELPGSSEGRVSLSEYLAFGVRDLRAPAYVTVAAVDEAGEVHVYLPRPGGEPLRAGPSTTPVVFRPSIDLGAAHRPGQLRLRALFSAAPLDAAAVRKALAVGAGPGATETLDLAAEQVTGVLTVGP